MSMKESAGRASEWVLHLSFLFILVEVIWMLLPFAGFLYGSVLHLQVLAQNPYTAWLTHFVFPVLTLGPVGPILMGLGLLVFFIGAGQIYWAKIRKHTHPVTGGLYRFVRHPQYIALTLFGVGVLLTWGRAISFLAFSLMMFLYYHLARSEEKRCVRLFGDEYERYREKTSFVIPGDRYLRPLGERLNAIRLPKAAWVCLGFLVTLLLSLGAMKLISQTKASVRDVPFLEQTVQLRDAKEEAEAPVLLTGRQTGVPYATDGRIVAVRGPYRNAAAAGFSERVVHQLRSSPALREHLAYLDDPNGDVAYVFSLPFNKPDQPGTPGMQGKSSTGRGPAADPAGPDRVRLAIMRCSLPQGSRPEEALGDKTRRHIRKACIVPVNLGRADGEEIVEGQITTPGPRFPAEDRWDFFMKQLSGMQASRSQGDQQATTTELGPDGSLVMVKAPILRTRMDAPFAEELFDRLLESKVLLEQLRKSGVGGDTVAVAFPRPGENWYRDHHGSPQVSVFVMLVRKESPDAPTASIFKKTAPDIQGAFTVEMDFGIARPKDSISGIKTIGPKRNLEERWQFFLSGL